MEQRSQSSPVKLTKKRVGVLCGSCYGSSILLPSTHRVLSELSKEVTAAANDVYGFARRDGFIRARAENRELMPAF